MKIDWKKYDSTDTVIDLRYNKITEMNWNGCPPSLTSISLNCNKITEMNWNGCPPGLTKIDLTFNKITVMNWDGCPPGLTEINLSFNIITEMNWEGCRNVLINILPCTYHDEYKKYKKTDAFIPYLPIVSKLKKELHYEIESIWWKCPDGILFKEDIKNLIESGYLN